MKSVFLFFSILLAFATAHNWVHSNSRAPIASTVGPCLPRRNDDPHVQIGPNQEFEIEWKTGHGFDNYFTIIHSKDEDKLKLINVKLLEEYIAGAPGGVGAKPAVKKYWKYHRKSSGDPLDNSSKSEQRPNFFARQVKEGDSEYRARPSNFGGQQMQLEYKSADMQDDRRVSYRNDKYPWIEAVHKYKQSAKQATRNDFATFSIPGRGGPGRYIVNYMWRGYRDCIDVEVNVDKKIEHIYGKPSEESSYERIDHCHLEDMPFRTISTHCQEVLGSPDACMKTCGPRGSFHCKAVLVAPVVNPITVDPKFRDITLLPWGAERPKSSNRPNDLWQCKKEWFVNATSDTLACVGIGTRSPTETYDRYALTDDPRDPYFYSTCYMIAPKLIWEGLPPAPLRKAAPWIHGQRYCTPCNVTAINSFRKLDTPRWKVTEDCVNCDANPHLISQPPTLFLEREESPILHSGSICEGTSYADRKFNYGNVKKLSLMGRFTGTWEEQICNALTKRDPECSNQFIFSRNRAVCGCIRKGQSCTKKTQRDFDVRTTI